MKRLQKLSVSPHLSTKNIKESFNQLKKYQNSIQGTSNRHIDISTIIEKGRQKKQLLTGNRVMGYAEGTTRKLPPLPETYFGSQIDEVSSVRDSVIENESRINQYRDKVKR